MFLRTVTGTAYGGLDIKQMADTGKHTEFWYRNLLEIVHLEDYKRNETLHKYVMEKGYELGKCMKMAYGSHY
jgi:hypothetical protein